MTLTNLYEVFIEHLQKITPSKPKIDKFIMPIFFGPHHFLFVQQGMFNLCGISFPVPVDKWLNALINSETPRQRGHHLFIYNNLSA